MTSEKTLRPYDVTEAKQLLGMQSDHYLGDLDEWAILHNGDHVSLHLAGSGYVSIPRDQFNAIVDWYMKEQCIQEAAHDK